MTQANSNSHHIRYSFILIFFTNFWSFEIVRFFLFTDRDHAVWGPNKRYNQWREASTSSYRSKCWSPAQVPRRAALLPWGELLRPEGASPRPRLSTTQQEPWAGTYVLQMTMALLERVWSERGSKLWLDRAWVPCVDNVKNVQKSKIPRTWKILSAVCY